MIYRKALKKNIPYTTLLGVSVTLFIGLFLSLCCYILYTDFFRSKDSADSTLSSEGYMILNKQVSIIDMFGQSKPVFKSEELEEIKKHDFIQEIAVFQAAKFRIKAYAPLHEDRSFYTDLFLESVPNEFLDVNKDFKWRIGQSQLPVIVPRTYLNLYNFGFAPSQNLPQISESTASTLSIKMEMEGPGGKHTFWGKIAGFTDRVNSILAPDEFINWANKNIANVENPDPSRIIIKTKNTADPELQKFINDNNYSTNKEILQASKAASVFKIILSFEFFQGILILLLSVGLILLSSLLMVERNKSLIFKLKLQSIPNKTISAFYIRYFLICSGAAALGALLLIYFVKNYYTLLISEFGFSSTHTWGQIMVAALILFLLTSGLAAFNIKRQTNKI